MARQTITPAEFIDLEVERCTELYAHLRSSMHGLTEEQAVPVVLKALADSAKKYLAPSEQKGTP